MYYKSNYHDLKIWQASCVTYGNTGQLSRPYKFSSAVYTIISPTGDRTSDYRAQTLALNRWSTLHKSVAKLTHHRKRVGDHGIHCWWNLIMLKQLSSVSVYRAQCWSNFLVKVIQFITFNFSILKNVYIYIYIWGILGISTSSTMRFCLRGCVSPSWEDVALEVTVSTFRVRM